MVRRAITKEGPHCSTACIRPGANVDKGLRFQTVVINSKDQMCLENSKDKRIANPYYAVSMLRCGGSEKQ
jgi:hypothetical protein